MSDTQPDDALAAEQFATFVNEARWQVAVTMPEIPHSYTTRRKCQEDGLEPAFEAAVLLIRRLGYEAMFGNYTYTYYDHDGDQFWSMGDALADTIILNRAKLPAG